MIFSRATFATSLFAAAASATSSGTAKNGRRLQQETNIVAGCVEEFVPDAGIDYFPEKYNKPVIASYGDEDIFGDKFVPSNTTDLLEIEYFGTYKIIYNRHQDTSYLLYQCGTPPPADEVDSGKHHLVIEVPHKGGLALTSTVQIPPIELLGLREEVIGYLDDSSFITSPCINAMIENNLTEVVWKGWGSPDQAPAVEEWLAANPDAIILGGPFGDPTAPNVLSISASQERTNVATFDWLAVYAALYNLEGTSNLISADAQEDYDCSAGNARAIADQRRNLQGEEFTRPVLLWASYFDGYNWSVAECPTWDSTYYCEYAAHCNADILSRPEGVGDDSTGFVYLNDEEFLEFGKDADVFIFPAFIWDSLYEEKKAMLDQFKSVQNQKVFDVQGQGSGAWFEQRLAEYDIVGLDVCHAVGNVDPSGPPHTPRYIRNVFTDPIGEGPTQCNFPQELSEPYIPFGQDCEPMMTEDDTTMPSDNGEPSQASSLRSVGMLISIGTIGMMLLSIVTNG